MSPKKIDETWIDSAMATDAEVASAVAAVLPSQTGNSGKYLKTDGSTVSWATVSGTGSNETLTIGSGLTGGSYDGSADVTIAVDTSTISTKSYVDDHINDSTAAHSAGSISFTAGGGISATNVQNAISELDSEKITATQSIVNAIIFG